ncbi:serine hydrolase domain-containing protein [Vibrio ouci]|uniref:Class A beta-lactamase-related serine hydrolase n=1 Tax=Vibrio ouci TaxID=2499078 RepID=A0A4Y8WCH1_9VIBR|nr:serine hydrolase domain-containing protein [Vibrio ouci]TFH90275.1 class A beta-lactamase-related serine hydrolase [Vibrio ouci]
MRGFLICHCFVLLLSVSAYAKVDENLGITSQGIPSEVRQSGAQAQEATPRSTLKQFEQAIQSYLSTHRIEQGVIGIVQRERLVHLKQYAKQPQANRPEQLYRIASVSKVLTLIAVLDLAQKGVVSLSDKPFSESGVLFNEWGDLPYQPEVASITLDHLLRHRAGLSQQLDRRLFLEPDLAPATVFQLLLNQIPLSFSPGAQESYSNVGYVVLGAVVRKVTGMSVYEYLARDTFKQIADFRLTASGGVSRIGEEVEYRSEYFELPYALNMSNISSAGGMATNARSLVQVLMRIDRLERVPDVLREPWSNYDYLGYDTWFLFGSLPGSSALIGRLNDTYSVVALFNGRNPDIDAQRNDLIKILSHFSGATEWEAAGSE